MGDIININIQDQEHWNLYLDVGEKETCVICIVCACKIMMRAAAIHAADQSSLSIRF